HHPLQARPGAERPSDIPGRACRPGPRAPGVRPALHDAIHHALRGLRQPSVPAYPEPGELDVDGGERNALNGEVHNGEAAVSPPRGESGSPDRAPAAPAGPPSPAPPGAPDRRARPAAPGPTP